MTRVHQSPDSKIIRFLSYKNSARSGQSHSAASSNRGVRSIYLRQLSPCSGLEKEMQGNRRGCMAERRVVAWWIESQNVDLNHKNAGVLRLVFDSSHGYNWPEHDWTRCQWLRKVSWCKFDSSSDSILCLCACLLTSFCFSLLLRHPERDCGWSGRHLSGAEGAVGGGEMVPGGRAGGLQGWRKA